MKAAQLLEEDIPKVRLIIAKKNGARFIEDPRTGANLPPFVWAEHYRVSAFEFYQAMKQFEGVKLFEFFEQRRADERIEA
jgi:hypothetical protein